MKSAILLFASVILSCPAVRAVVIAGGNGTQNFTPPPSGVPWAHVGDRGVYLGNYGGNFWALTAAHVGEGALNLSGISYSLVPGSAVRVLNGDNSLADLTLFRIATDPGLGTLSLATAAPAASAVVAFVGDGGIESGSQLYWSVSGTTWTPMPSATGSTHSGYAVGGGAGMRWGEAVVAGATTYNVGTGVTAAFSTQFLSAAGSSQGASGDSGNAVFHFVSGTWQLAGIMGAIATYNGQPPNTAVFGNLTYAADMGQYRGFITSAIPEPAECGALLAGLTGLLAMLYRRGRHGKRD